MPAKKKGITKPRIALIAQVVLFLLIILGGVSAYILVNRQQDIRQNAWVGFNDVQDTCINGSCEIETKSSGNFISSQNNYKIDLNKSMWQEGEIPKAASPKNQDASFFVIRDRAGFATIFVNYEPLDEKSKNLDVKSLAQYLENNIKVAKNAKNTKYLGYEIKTIGEREFIKFNYEEEFLKQKSVYSEYILTDDSGLLELETRTMGFNLLVEGQVNWFLNNIQFVEGNSEKTSVGSVKGVSTDNSLTFSESELTQLVKPSVAKIYHVYCKSINPSEEMVVAGMKSAYSFCSGATGSGFLIGDDGLVATNGHVVIAYPEEDIIVGLAVYPDSQIIDFFTDLVRASLSEYYGIKLTKSESKQIVEEVLTDPTTLESTRLEIAHQIDQGYISVETLAEKYYVNLGNNPVEMNSEKYTPEGLDGLISLDEGIFEASFEGADYGNDLSADVLLRGQIVSGSDVALLKIISDQPYKYPGLSLGSLDSVNEGDRILILGFPGVAEGSGANTDLLDYGSSTTKVTVTQGIVSSIKKDRNGLNLIQTDASVGHGNSGGPAFDDMGNVIGLATYGLGDEVGNFNFLRDIADLKNLADLKSVVFNQEQPTVYGSWRSGLELYWQNKFTKSITQFNNVEELYPIHPTAQNFLNDAEEAIKAGKDVDLIFGVDRELVMFAGVGLVVLILAISVALIVSKMKKHKDTSGPSSPPDVQMSANTDSVAPSTQMQEMAEQQVYSPPLDNQQQPQANATQQIPMESSPESIASGFSETSGVMAMPTEPMASGDPTSVSEPMVEQQPVVEQPAVEQPVVEQPTMEQQPASEINPKLVQSADSSALPENPQ